MHDGTENVTRQKSTPNWTLVAQVKKGLAFNTSAKKPTSQPENKPVSTMVLNWCALVVCLLVYLPSPSLTFTSLEHEYNLRTLVYQGNDNNNQNNINDNHNHHHNNNNNYYYYYNHHSNINDNNNNIHTTTQTKIRTKRLTHQQSMATASLNFTWPTKKVVATEGEVMLGGLMMVHERHNDIVCGPIMPQGGVQALEAMLYALDFINDQEDFIPGVRIGTHILDDCDKDTYGLEQAVDFIKGPQFS
ncbi:hypothetical protein Pmani_002263 [Petrolisthes manimaculis]|uniref:Receptor ligand binding region domain-containing protein n=1 Tax=Petrolisthes manimaculis TaxID=1843537 RepID=A0AAE1UR63_9EUCA|nr:hypothetical protein Pmani_002263 [Petrolisthes manimaculis]